MSNSNNNIILPILALGLYCHCNNVNVANNTTMLIIIYVLLSRRRLTDIFDDGDTDVIINQSNRPSNQNNQPNIIYPQNNNNCGCGCGCYPNYYYYNNYRHGCGCGCGNIGNQNIPWSPYYATTYSATPYTYTNTTCGCNTGVL